MASEYEILPEEEIAHLRKELERLKASPFLHGEHGDNLLNAVRELNENIRTLIRTFREADKELAQYYADTNPARVLSDIKQQNETLAKGMLALADLIKVQSTSTVTSSSAPKPMAPAPISTSAEPQQDEWNFEKHLPKSATIPQPVIAPSGSPLSSSPTFRHDNVDDFPMPPSPPKKGFFGRK